MSFRKDFAWGAATAAYQIEGAAYEDGRGESVWDVHCHDTRKNPEGKQNILDGETGDVSCDFYHHYEEDIQRMKNMGLKAFRFSISWSRVLPDGTGRVNEKGLQFYSDLVDALLEAEIEPWVTLFHWDFPQQLQIRGGWQNPESPEWFAEYTVIVNRLSDRVSHWMTLNEPQCHLIIGHVQGNCAPKLRLTEPEYLLAIHNHLKAHGRAVQVIRKYAKKKPEIGVAFCFGSSVPVSDQPEESSKNCHPVGRYEGPVGSLLVAGSRHFRTLSGERHGSLWRELPGGVTESGRPETDLGTVGFPGNQCLPERTSGIGWSGGISRGEESLRSTGDCNEVAGDTGESVLCTEVPAGKIQTSHRNYGERTVLSRLGIPGR